MLETLRQAMLIALAVFVVALIALTAVKTSHRRSPQPSKNVTENHELTEGANEAAKKNDAWFESATLIFNGILSIGTFVLAIANIGLWRYAAGQAADMKHSITQARATAIAAKKSADVAEKTLVATQRPWIGFKSFWIAEPLTFDVNGARISVTYELENTGNSPAESININVLTFNMPSDLSQPGATQAKQIEEIKNRPPHPLLRTGYVLFPGQTIQQTITAYVTKDEIEKAAQTPLKFFFPFIIATVEYKFTFDDTKHVTSWIFELRKLPNRTGFQVDDRNDVQPQELVLTSNFYCGAYAD